MRKLTETFQVVFFFSCLMVSMRGEGKSENDDGYAHVLKAILQKGWIFFFFLKLVDILEEIISWGGGGGGGEGVGG